MTVQAISKVLSRYDCSNIIITGGEPLMQELSELLVYLKRRGYWVALETNGDYDFEMYREFLDWITVSPKCNDFYRGGDELKLVYEGQDLTKYLGGFRYYYLQPCSMKNVRETYNAVLKNPKWRLSCQTQKLINIR